MTPSWEAQAEQVRLIAVERVGGAIGQLDDATAAPVLVSR
jgi:hypothetical protein